MTPIRKGMVWAAKRGMFRTSDRIDVARGYDGVLKLRPEDPVAVADARTSMCDYRIALATALGKPCDRNGYTNVGRAEADPGDIHDPHHRNLNPHRRTDERQCTEEVSQKARRDRGDAVRRLPE